MEIKRSKDIIFENRSLYEKKGWKEHSLKKWIDIDTLIKHLKDFPAYHFSSLEKDRLLADKIVNKLIEEINSSTSPSATLPKAKETNSSFIQEYKCATTSCEQNTNGKCYAYKYWKDCKRHS